MPKRGETSEGEQAAVSLVPPIPSPRVGTIERTPLLERLRASDAHVIEVAAPAGYGKSTLLAQWCQAERRPVAWLSLDERDDDPVVLMRRLATAVRTGIVDDPGLADHVVAAGTVLTAAVPRIGRALARLGRPAVLVLDDVHVLVNQTSLDALASLARHVPEGSQVVFAGRTVTGLPTARWRVAGALLELGPVELALSVEETGAVLAAHGPARSADDVAAIHAYTEGWPAGVYLASLEPVRPAPDDDEPPRIPHLDEYVRLEHLAALPAEDVEFLTHSSVLEPFTAPLCDAVLRRKDSALRLAHLEATNLFVIPLHGSTGAYRYHQVYRDVLREELERRDPGAAGRIQRDAAAWYASRGYLEAAIDYALAADDLYEVAQLVEQIGTQVYRNGRIATVEAWLDALDGEVLVERPRAAIIGGLVHAMEGRAVEAAQWLGMAERADPDFVPEPGSTIAGWTAVLRGLLMAGGVEQVQADAATALEEVSPFSPWRAAAISLAAVALEASGEGDPRPLYDDAADVGARNGSIHAKIVALAYRARLALADHDDALAAATIDRARGVVTTRGMEEAPTSAIVAAVAARVELRRGNGAAARAELARAQRLRTRVNFALPWTAVRLRIELATALLALADPAGATILLREIDDIVARRPGLGTLRDEVEDLRQRVRTSAAGSLDGWASTLTEAELRLLPLLTTHLTFREIGARLFVSQNTVKTQAISVYRKLGASSRGEAIARAAEIGLIDEAAASVTPLQVRRSTLEQPRTARTKQPGG